MNFPRFCVICGKRCPCDDEVCSDVCEKELDHRRETSDPRRTSGKWTISWGTGDRR